MGEHHVAKHLGLPHLIEIVKTTHLEVKQAVLWPSSSPLSRGIARLRVFDIIDSRNTRDASNSVASESVNTVLKVIGDSKDLVQLTHDFVKATKADVATLNRKHSVVGDMYNKVDVTSDGDAVNQVYKATFNRQEAINGNTINTRHTVFLEIQDGVQVDLL